jgi:hypothetical protein
LVFGAKVGADTHLADDSSGYVGREIFWRDVAAAAVGFEALFAFDAFGDFCG